MSTPQESTRPHATLALRLKDAALVLALLVLALLPRTVAPGDFWTADEAKHWSVRVDAFLPALEAGDYAATNLVGHPGVTTMWLGSLGVLAQRFLSAQGWLPPDDDGFLYRQFLRMPIAFATSLALVLAFLMVRRLFGQRVALLTALLWIFDPFLVAHSKVLHVDALLTFFVWLSLLAALVALRLDEQDPGAKQAGEGNAAGIRWGMLVASAVAGGLALLTKSPSLILFPMTGLIVLVGLVRLHTQETDPVRLLFAGPRQFVAALPFKQLVLVLAAWGGVALVVWVALWPAAWVDPIGSAATVINEIFRNGAEPHGWGNFFLGRPVEVPGPLFYPVAIALRLTPWTMAGLLVAGMAAYWQWWAERVQASRSTPDEQRLIPGSSMALVLVLVYALVFVGIMTLLAKKFDRYVLPVFPVFDLVAAFGLICLGGCLRRGVAAWARQRAERGEQAGRLAAGAYWGLLLVAMAVNLAWYHPYELGYFNQALGGGPVAEHTIYVGWGEGLEHAADYIAQQYNGCDLGVASWYELVILPYTCSPTLHMGYITVPGHVHYAVLYVNQVQRNIHPEIVPHLRERGSLVHTVTIHGINYAYVYQLRQPRQYDISADFGSEMRLTGYDVDATAVRSSGVLTLTLQWLVREEMDQDYMMFVHVFDEEGNEVGQLDVPPGGHLPTSTWGHNHVIDWVHRIPVQRDGASDSLWLSLGIYDPATFERLPLDGPAPPPGAPDDGPGSLVLRVETGTGR